MGHRGHGGTLHAGRRWAGKHNAHSVIMMWHRKWTSCSRQLDKRDTRTQCTYRACTGGERERERGGESAIQTEQMLGEEGSSADIMLSESSTEIKVSYPGKSASKVATKRKKGGKRLADDRLTCQSKGRKRREPIRHRGRSAPSRAPSCLK